jgi:glycopeptide antibiotics resistance protein
MKRIYIIIIVIVIAAITFSGYKDVVQAPIQSGQAASQSEGAIPQSGLPAEASAQAGDLCGGTGGNGQIISVGKNTFTLKRNDDGSNQIIHLTGQATIKTSTGSVPLSDLKAGERVTLVGGPNRDGSFTADTVVVCTGTQENLTGQEIQSGQKQRADFNKQSFSSNKINTWSLYINVSIILLVVLIWIGTLAFLRRKIKKSLTYLLFFTIFYIYIVKVLDYTLFQYQSLILLKHFTSGLMLNGQTAEKSLNLIPLITLTPEDLKTSFLNILLLIPFGFGLPFITNLRMTKIVVIGAFFSILIEFLQLITGLLANITFRIADINDVIFNTVGVATGYILFVGFVRIYRHISHNWDTSGSPILRHIAERPQIDKQ